jgi:hypothetical protein
MWRLPPSSCENASSNSPDGHNVSKSRDLWQLRPVRGQAGFFDVDERLKELSAKGDSLERLNAVVELVRASENGWNP